MAEANLSRVNDSLDNYLRGASELEKLVASNPRSLSWNRELMLAYGHAADVSGNPGLQNLGDRKAALNYYQKAAEIGKELHLADPSYQRAATDYGIVLSRVETVMEDVNPTAKISIENESLRLLPRQRRSIRPTGLSRFIRRLSFSTWAVRSL